ncbi:MAG: MBL fold metallo-hydrolase [Blautia sp.]|nr:MBL fold metallo-hydrolase [Blautia sp.]
MRENYIAHLPDRAGTFEDVCLIIAEDGGSIDRINYNKGIDEKTIFLEVSGEEAALRRIREKLLERGYLGHEEEEGHVELLDLELPNGVGALMPVLKIISRHHVNISFVNYRKRTALIQRVRLGLLICSQQMLQEIMEELSAVCSVSLAEYEVTERSVDGTVFYETFAHEMQKLLSLTKEQTEQVLIQSNRIMQMLELDTGNEAYLKTFEYIRRFAGFILDHKGEHFCPAISSRRLDEEMTLHVIEPPCGSNTYILEYMDELWFIDSGFSCYRDEMLSILRDRFPGFDSRKKSIMITHADVDHIGLLDLFDAAYMNQTCLDNFRLEKEKRPNFREQNIMHQPYIFLSKIITGYCTPDLSRCTVVGVKKDEHLLSRIGTLHFGEKEWRVYEGPGGHVRGETVIACPELKLVFTGDIYVNIKGFSEEQRAFNILAPYLMTRVDEDSPLATATRRHLLEKFDGYTLCPGHGPVVDESQN